MATKERSVQPPSRDDLEHERIELTRQWERNGHMLSPADESRLEYLEELADEKYLASREESTESLALEDVRRLLLGSGR